MVCTRKSSACGVCIWGGARNVWREAHRVDPCVTKRRSVWGLRECILSEVSHHLSGVAVCFWRHWARCLKILESVCPCASELLRRVSEIAPGLGMSLWIRRSGAGGDEGVLSRSPLCVAGMLNTDSFKSK